MSKLVRVLRGCILDDKGKYRTSEDESFSLPDKAADIYASHGNIKIIGYAAPEAPAPVAPAVAPAVDYDVNNTLLGDYGFDEKLVKLLNAGSVSTVEQLEVLSREDLIAMSGIGEATADSILEALAQEKE